MSVYLEALVPTTGLVAWWPLDNDTPGTLTIADESGNQKTLLASGVPAPITANQINGRKAVVHNLETDLWTDAAAPTTPALASVKEIWVIAKVDFTTTFPAAYGGFISGFAALNYPLYVGNTSTNRWLSTGEGSPFASYYRSGTLTADGARVAPFTYFEQLRQTNGTALSLDGVQFGQDRTFTTRLFKGKWCDAMCFSTARTASEVARLKLYGDLKFGLWLLNSTTLTFPDPTITGIGWARFKLVRKDWDAVTISHTYDDEGKSFNTSTNTPPTFWEIGFNGLTYAQVQIFDAFNDAARRDRTFSFIDKWGVTWTGVRIVSYDRDHKDHISQDHNCQFTLAKF